MQPRHVAIIMDGNGRWANTRGLPRVEGHRKGAESVRDVVRAARQVGIECLTLYAFSSQNWQRPLDEVEALMQLLREYLLEERQEIMENDIRLIAIGHIERLPAIVREPLDALIRDSSQNKSMTLCLALSYGAREALVDAARAAIRSRIPPEALTESTISSYLPTRDLPPLDLLIRTSGEQRISNFLLWEAAYAELYFTDTLWPDFRRGELYTALEAYAGRERRFGLTSEQLRAKANE
ncbi:MAG: di-trans,poly-cis-decaprenylcistransferase [Deltaproteobacteria bacterium]|nr:di-trans,poly-cis-decaprenylcistransferase [Deltaproteobacteria bacterium]